VSERDLTGVYADMDGKHWFVTWGIDDPDLSLLSSFHTSLAFLEANGKRSVFQDPLYKNETKTLMQYADTRKYVDTVFLVGELTPGIWAVGAEA
jgi:hypothetical protein